MAVIDPAVADELARRVGVLEDLLDAERRAHATTRQELAAANRHAIAWERLAKQHARQLDQVLGSSARNTSA